MKVYLDRAKCEGYANCVDAAPGIFEIDDADCAVVLIDEPGADRHEEVRRAMRLCPVEAITIEE